jgi:CheY-like chemotaxis protein
MSAHRTILVADDDSNDAYLLQRAFSKAGITAQVEFVQDGEQAIEYLKTVNRTSRNPVPELLVLDLKMPRVNGFEVLEWIRRQPGLRRMLIIVLTSSDEPRDINRAYDLGANSYLVKPCDMGQLTGMAEYMNNYWLNLNRHPDLTI